jgi:hypothetical protein
MLCYLFLLAGYSDTHGSEQGNEPALGIGHALSIPKGIVPEENFFI